MTHLTAAHVTHEARDKIGGIGSVLEGILTSPVYQQHIKRSILVGPYPNHIEGSPADRLGPDATVLYSTIDGIDEQALGGKLHPIEWAFQVAFIYGRRSFYLPGSDDHTGQAEVLLIDVFNSNQQRTNQFKRRLNEVFDINSMRYESDWGYEEYVRLAEPAFYALLALLRHDELPCLLFSHEFMGLPTAFKATIDGQQQFRTVFHVHECGTARQIVESHPGHDTAFYNILKQARRNKLYVSDVFGDRSASFRHALVSKAHICDAIIAVGDFTAQEMHFLGPQFDHHHIDLVYNGVPHLDVTYQSEIESRNMLVEYAGQLLPWEPDVLMTHITRPVISKGIWRDVMVCHELERHFADSGLRGVLFIVTSAAGTRRPQDVLNMEKEYGWPRHHRPGYPDLVGPEIGLNQMIEQFNATHQHVQAVLVNQFGWSRSLIGQKVPADMTLGDLRRATDIEFGMATYEPFGISPLEPLGSGAICVISSVCGCAGFINKISGGLPVENVIEADFTRLEREQSIEPLLAMTHAQRDAIEKRVAAEVAQQIMSRLPADGSTRRALLESGQVLVKRLGWDQVLEDTLIPMLRRVMSSSVQRERRPLSASASVAIS